MERLLGGTTEMLSRHVERLGAGGSDEQPVGTADVARLTTAIAQFVRAAATVAAPSGGFTPAELASLYAELDREQGLT